MYNNIEVSCPTTHPFAYFRGQYCCETDEDFYGNPISITSTTCRHENFVFCPASRCKNTEGIL